MNLKTCPESEHYHPCDYWIARQGESYVVWSHRDRPDMPVQLGTVVKLAERDWEFIANGIWIESGKNLFGRRATLREAAQAVAANTARSKRR